MIVLFCLMLAAAQAGRAPADAGGSVAALTHDIAASGQAVELAIPPSQRISPPARIAPGAPPLLAFRYYEGREHHRFNGMELMLDDAGH